MFAALAKRASRRIALRAATFKRKEKIVKKQMAAQKQDAEAALLKNKLKLAELEIKQSKFTTAAEKSAAKHEIEKMKEATRAAKLVKDADDARFVDLRIRFAASVFRGQLNFFRDGASSSSSSAAASSEKDKLARLTANLHEKRPWCMSINTPEFWAHNGHVGRHCISHPTNFDKIKEHDKLWASSNFAWELFGQKQQHIQGLTAIENAVRQLMPGYNKIVAPRWTIQDTLAECRNDVDVAWLTMVWRYSKILGKSAYPCGLFQWPPTTT